MLKSNFVLVRLILFVFSDLLTLTDDDRQNVDAHRSVAFKN